VNGVADTITSNVVGIAYVNGEVWQENSSDMWWGKASPTASWSPGAGTTTSPLDAVSVPSSETSVKISASMETINATSGNHMVFISGSHDVFSLSGGTLTVSDTGSDNRFQLPAAGKGTAVFNAAASTNGDMFDLTTALAATKWSGSASTLSSYLHVVQTARNTELLVTANAASSGGTLLATFDGAKLSLSTILAHSFT
jgi:hypothetical protein